MSDSSPRVYSQRPGADDNTAKGTVVGLRFLADRDRRSPTAVDLSASSDEFARIVLKLSAPAKPDAVPSGKPSATPDGSKSGPGKYFVRHADGKTTYSGTPESAWGPPEEAGGRFVPDGYGNWIWHAW